MIFTCFFKTSFYCAYLNLSSTSVYFQYFLKLTMHFWKFVTCSFPISDWLKIPVFLYFSFPFHLPFCISECPEHRYDFAVQHWHMANQLVCPYKFFFTIIAACTSCSFSTFFLHRKNSPSNGLFEILHHPLNFEKHSLDLQMFYVQFYVHLLLGVSFKTLITVRLPFLPFLALKSPNLYLTDTF